MAPGGGRGPGLDPGGRGALPVWPGRRPDHAVEALHGAARGRAAAPARAPAGLPGGDVRGRGVPGVPGDRALGSGVAELPRRPGPAGRRRVHVDLGAHDAAVGGRAPDGPGVDGRRRLLPLRARLGRQRLVVRPPHRRGAPAHPARGLRREVAGGGRRRRRLRAGGLPARARSGDGPHPAARDPRGRRHELVAAALGGGPARPAPRRGPVPDGPARPLRVARRALQRAGGGGVVAQPDPHPRGGRPPSGVVARRLAHRVVQRRGRRVRPRRRRTGRVGPAPHRHRRAVVLLPARVVARRREAGVHRHPLPPARPRRGVGRGGARRHGPLSPIPSGR